MNQDVSQDLEGRHQVQRSKIANVPQCASPVLITQYGWAKRGEKTVWDKELRITPLYKDSRTPPRKREHAIDKV